MKVIAFNGSPKKEGNTFYLINKVLETLQHEGVETQIVHIGGKNIRGCQACYQCKKNKDSECAMKDDIINDCIKMMSEADGIIIGSPTYFADLTSDTKAFIDRTGFVARANGNLFKRKLGAAVVSQRRAGAIHTFDSINHLFTISEMIVVGSNYWNLGFGAGPGDVVNDNEGMENMKNLGENMAWLLKKTKTV